MNPNPILHAEDDENDAFFFKHALEKAGMHFPVAHARNGEDALHYLTGVGPYADRAKHPFPCLLITDLKMPKLSGFDLLHLAKPILESKHLPAIVLTASVSDSDRDRAIKLGAKACFTKPNSLQDLIAIARDLKASWLTQVTQLA